MSHPQTHLPRKACGVTNVGNKKTRRILFSGAGGLFVRLVPCVRSATAADGSNTPITFQFNRAKSCTGYWKLIEIRARSVSDKNATHSHFVVKWTVSSGDDERRCIGMHWCRVMCLVRDTQPKISVWYNKISK